MNRASLHDLVVLGQHQVLEGAAGQIFQKNGAIVVRSGHEPADLGRKTGKKALPVFDVFLFFFKFLVFPMFEQDLAGVVFPALFLDPADTTA